jgi:signal transduction histidine kinase
VSVFANLPISRKLVAAFAAVIAVIFASGAIVYERLLVIEAAKERHVHTTDVLETLQKATDAMVDQETGVRGYLITGEERFLEPYHRGGNAFTAAIQKIQGLLSHNPAQQSRIDELNALAKKWRSEVAEREIALMAKPETREDARALEGSTAGKTAMDFIRAKVGEIDGAERNLLAKREAAQKQAFATAYTTTILGGAISLVIATLMGVLLTRGIAVPITRMTGAMTTLAKGDTSVEVPRIRHSDEIGAMAASVRIFKDSMIEREKARADLAHVNRVTTMGQLTASIAHEVNQPLAGVVTSGNACLRWLAAEPPNLEAARRSVERMIRDGHRAGEVVDRIRAMVKKAPPKKDRLDINETISDVIALTRSEAHQHGVSSRIELARGLPHVLGDRVQLQQVILNLIINAIEAMSGVSEGARELRISTGKGESDGVLVQVRDSGPGLDPESLDRLFDAFYTTKPNGMGMGLSICRSIIEAHGGRLWATANVPRGAIFQFTLPT